MEQKLHGNRRVRRALVQAGWASGAVIASDHCIPLGTNSKAASAGADRPRSRPDATRSSFSGWAIAYGVFGRRPECLREHLIWDRFPSP
jgi:hypothetical protein